MADSRFSPGAAGSMAQLAHRIRMRDSIASVSLSHDQDCTCTVCRAAQGDESAFAEVMDSMAQKRL